MVENFPRAKKRKFHYLVENFSRAKKRKNPAFFLKIRVPEYSEIIVRESKNYLGIRTKIQQSVYVHATLGLKKELRLGL